MKHTSVLVFGLSTALCGVACDGGKATPDAAAKATPTAAAAGTGKATPSASAAAKPAASAKSAEPKKDEDVGDKSGAGEKAKPAAGAKAGAGAKPAAGEKAAAAKPEVKKAAAEEKPKGKAAFSCGNKGQKKCPMQAWMSSAAGSAVASGDPKKLARVFQAIAAKPVAGMGQWSAIASQGAAVAASGKFDEAKQFCKKCHGLYQHKYVNTMRDRPW